MKNPIQTLSYLLAVGLFSALLVACGSSSGADGGAGTGGENTGSGGGSGGVGPTGGFGAAPSTGGTPSNTGGASTGGGSLGSGGGASGGMSGSDTSAGASGGFGVGGSGGSAVGGAPAGGAPASGGGGSVGGDRSAGCGATPQLTSGAHTIDVDGMSREYTLKIPDGYDPDTAHKLIFGWHWRGGQMSDVVGGQIIGGPYYGLESRANGSAIFVAPEGIDNGWANMGGRDIRFLEEMLDLFFDELCIDTTRLFSTGFSYGGMMSNAIGCAMAERFRAIAPMSGSLYSGCDQRSDHPLAVLWLHGTDDNVVPIGDGQSALDIFMERNNCSGQGTPVDPSPCVAFECDEGYPVHRCEFSGSHSPQQWAPDALWDFFSQF